MALHRRTRRRVVVGLFIVLAVVAFRRSDDVWQWLLDHEQLAHDLVNERPISAFFVGLGAFTLISLVPGLLGKSLAMAWLFGFWRALAIANISLTVAALIEYFLTRWLLRDAIQSRFGLRLLKVNEALAQDGAFYLFSMRVAHVPYTATNYLMGATSMRPLPFWFATQLGLLPSNIVFCYAGSQLPSLAEVAEHGVARIMTPQLWIGFILLAVLPWVGKAAVRRLRRVASGE